MHEKEVRCVCVYTLMQVVHFDFSPPPAQRKPATMFNRIVIRSDLRHTNKVIRKTLGTSGYRMDLIEVCFCWVGVVGHYLRAPCLMTIQISSRLLGKGEGELSSLLQL